MNVQNPEFEKKVREIFEKANFISRLGIHLSDVKPGWCETRLQVELWHKQQDEVVHAGVLATMADHTAGAAGCSLIREDEIVLTVEFKISFLRPAIGEALVCQSHVLRQGKQLITAESEVFSIRDKDQSLVAKAMVTLAVVQPLSAQSDDK